MNAISSDNIILPSGQVVSDAIKTLEKDLDYVRYLPVSAYYIAWPDFIGSSDVGSEYTAFPRPAVTKLSHHAPNILPTANDDGSLALNRYYNYLFQIHTTVRILNTASHLDAHFAVGVRLRDAVRGGYYDDVGFLSTYVSPRQVGNFDQFIDITALVTQPSSDPTPILQGKNLAALGSDLTYISTNALVLAFPKEGAI